MDVPMPEDKGLLSDKKTAYEQSAFEKKQKEKMNTLQNLAVSLEQEEPAADEVFLTEGGHGQRQSVYPFLGQCLSGHQPAVGQFL